MATYNTNEFKSGLKILIDQDPCIIIENEFVKPGKGQAFVRIKFKNLKTGRTLEKTFKSGESVEAADILEKEMQYLYSDGTHFHFMEPESYEQYMASAAVVGEAKKWLREEDHATLILWNGAPISIECPNFVVLKVIETEPGIKGDTVTGGNKTATLETGATIKLPLFINTGDLVKIDTRTGSYVSRVKG